MTRKDYRFVRTLLASDGRLQAIKYLRGSHHQMPFLVARMVVGDIAENRRWTCPPRKTGGGAS